MSFERPEAFLLLLPAALIVLLLGRGRFRSPGRTVLAGGLRLLALACLVAAFAGPHRVTVRAEVDRIALVVDESASVVGEPRPAALATLLAGAPRLTLPFGDATASDARPALLRAATSGAGLVVLATDGRTEGGETALLADLAALGVPSGVVPIGEPGPEPPGAPAAPLFAGLAPPPPGEPLPIRVRAPDATRVRLRIDGVPAGAAPVMDGVARFPDADLGPGEHELLAVAEGPGGSAASIATVHMPGPLPVLVLGPEPEGAVAASLAAQGMEVRVGTAWPKAPDARVVVILPGFDLAGAGERAARFVRAGGGLFVATGPPPGLAALTGTPVADLLPARAAPAPPEAAPPPPNPPPPEPDPPGPEGATPKKTTKEARTVTILLVMDRSGSMAGEKILVARAACYATAATLDPEDRLGILAFSDTFEWIRDFGRAGDLTDVRRSLARLVPGGGTEIFPAMEEGFDAIRKETSGIRHVILVSDGQDLLTGFKKLVSEARADGITVSAIGVGSDFEYSFLSSIAEWGSGAFRDATDPRNLPALVTLDAKRVLERREPPEEPPSEDVTAGTPEPAEPEPERPPEPPPAEPVPLSAPSPLPFLAGLSFPPLPETEPVEARFPATVALATPDGTPALTLWRHGAGRVAHLAGDPGAWATWPDLPRFLGQLVRLLAGSEPGDAPAPGIRVLGDRVVVRSSGAAPTAEADGPDGPTDLALAPIAPGEWTARLPDAPPGTVLTLRASTPEGGRAAVAVVVPPAPESRRGLQKARIDRLAAAAGRVPGEVPPPPPPRRVPGREPLELPFLLAALALLPLDVAARRVR